MKIIRASEIGTYQFCHRAWWYQLQGLEPDNKHQLAWGNDLHEKHGRAVLAASCLQIAAYTSLLLAILLATIWIIQRLL